jgi:hypothetical protein
MRFIVNWCATHVLSAAVLLAAAVTIPTAWGLEQRMDAKTGENADKIEDVAEEVDDEVPGTEPTTPIDDESPAGSTGTTKPGGSPTTQPQQISVTDEQIIRIIAEFCQENDCRPIFVDQAEVQEPEHQDPELDNPEHQEPELQEAEVQEAEVQEAPIPGPTGATGKSGPACPAGYSLREVRIPSVSNRMIFLVCAR